MTNNAMINHKKLKNMLFYAITKEVDFSVNLSNFIIG